MTVVFTSPLDIPLELREALYCHEILRTIGIPAAQIYLVHSPGQVAVLVRQAGKEVPLVAYPTALSETQLAEQWPVAVALWNATCNEHLDWSLEDSPACSADGRGAASRRHSLREGLV